MRFTGAVPSTATIKCYMAASRDPTVPYPPPSSFQNFEKSQISTAWNMSPQNRELNFVGNGKWMPIDTSVTSSSSTSAADKLIHFDGIMFLAIDGMTGAPGDIVFEVFADFEFRGRDPYDTTTFSAYTGTVTTSTTTQNDTNYRSFDRDMSPMFYSTLDTRNCVQLRAGLNLVTIQYYAPMSAGTTVARAYVIRDVADTDVSATRFLVKLDALAAGATAAAGTQYLNNTVTGTGTSTTNNTDIVSFIALIRAIDGDYLTFYIDDDDTKVANQTISIVRVQTVRPDVALNFFQKFFPSATQLPYYM